MSRHVPRPRAIRPSALPPSGFSSRNLDISIGQGKIERVAAQSLRLPHPSDDPRSLHELGTTRPVDNRAAAGAVTSLLRKTQETSTFTYKEYFHACAHVGALKTKAMREERERLANGYVLQSLLSPQEREFLKLYTADAFTPDLNGYIAYQAAFSPDLETHLKESVPIYIPEEARLEHTFTAGSPGRGKTELFKTLIYSYVIQPGLAAVVVLDPHGDYSRQIARWTDFVGNDRLVYFDARLDPHHLPCINPFETDADQWGKQVLAQEIVAGLQEILGSGEGSTMSVQMDALLLNSVLVLLDYPNATLRDLRRLLQGDEQLVEFGRRSRYGDAADFFEHSFHRENYNQTKNSILAKLARIFSSGIFGDLTCGKSTIDLEGEIERKRVIVFNVGGIGRIEGPAFGRLLMAILQGIARRRERIPEHKRTVTHVFADEIQTLVTPSVADILGQCRKFRMILTMAQPIIGEGMSPELKKAVTGAPNLQITGFCQPSERAEAARLVECAPEEIGTLSTGEFIMRAGNRPPVRFRNRSDLLGFKHRMSEGAWNRLKARQLRAYYRPKQEEEPPEPQSTEGKSTDEEAAPGTW